MKWFDAWLGSRTYAKLALAKLRAEMSSFEGRIEAIEVRQSDLHDRFNRFQNRVGMREARAAMEVDQSMLQEAEAILAQQKPVAEAHELPPSKMALWKKRRFVT